MSDGDQVDSRSPLSILQAYLSLPELPDCERLAILVDRVARELDRVRRDHQSLEKERDALEREVREVLGPLVRQVVSNPDEMSARGVVDAAAQYIKTQSLTYVELRASRNAYIQKLKQVAEILSPVPQPHEGVIAAARRRINELSGAQAQVTALQQEIRELQLSSGSSDGCEACGDAIERRTPDGMLLCADCAEEFETIDTCEGCHDLAVVCDVEGVPLCRACFDELAEEVLSQDAAAVREDFEAERTALVWALELRRDGMTTIATDDTHTAALERLLQDVETMIAGGVS